MWSCFKLSCRFCEILFGLTFRRIFTHVKAPHVLDGEFCLSDGRHDWSRELDRIAAPGLLALAPVSSLSSTMSNDPVSLWCASISRTKFLAAFLCSSITLRRHFSVSSGVMTRTTDWRFSASSVSGDSLLRHFGSLKSFLWRIGIICLKYIWYSIVISNLSSII